MNFKKSALTALTILSLAAIAGCSKGETSVPAKESSTSSASAPIPMAAADGLIEGQNYTVLEKPIAQKEIGKVEVLEFFGYFCPHCAHLEPILSEHVKSFKPDTYLRTEHVVWSPDMQPLARLAAAVDMSGEKPKANSVIFDAMVNKKVNLADENTLKKWLSEQTAFDGKKVLANFNSPESKTRADEMAKLTDANQISGTPTVIVGGKYQVKFSDWQSGMHTIDLLVDKVREEQKTAK